MKKTGIKMTFLLRLIALTVPFLGGAACSYAQSEQYVILVDVSASRDSFQQREATDYLRRVAQSLSFGDELVVLKIQQDGLHDHNGQLIETIPAPRSSRPSRLEEAELADRRESIGHLLVTFMRPPQGAKVLHTDIIATLHLAEEQIRDRGSRRTTLMILSDMLQSTPLIEMDKLRRMPSLNWIDSQRQKGLLPMLAGVCVNVAGADSTTSSGITVKNFWTRFFALSGAQLLAQNYRSSVPRSVAKNNCQ